MAKSIIYRMFLRSHQPFKNYWQFLLAVLALCVFISTFFYTGSFTNYKTVILSILWSFAICITQWIGNAILAGYLNEKVPWIEQPIKRTILGVLGTAIYSTVAYFIVQLTMRYLVFGEFPEDPMQWALRNIETPVIISLSFTTVFIAVGFFNRWREMEGVANKYEAEMMTYKYEALRNQINPHFLFNSFNVLTDLVYEDQDMAARFIQQLSEIYRYVLDSRDKELVSLKEELTFIDSYLFLLKIRFEDKLVVENELQDLAAGELTTVSSKNLPLAEQMIVPMSLQLLIENAVKHNEVSTAQPLKVVLRQEGDRLVVWNSLCLKNVGEDSKKTGLKNIKDQYARWTEEEIVIRETEEAFEVRLPVLKKG